MAAPIPDDPPVTIAFNPANSIVWSFRAQASLALEKFLPLASESGHFDVDDVSGL